MGNLRRALPPLTSLVVFEAAARQLNFTKTSQELLVTREAVSRQIRLLEDFLGVSLFERSGKALSLTAAGELFVGTVSPSIESIARVTQKIVQNPDINQAATAEAGEGAAPEPSAGEKQGKILLVDDEPMNITMMTELLQDDYEVISESSGRYALKAAQETPDIDLILLDVQMPGMNGHEVCRELKGNFLTENIPVIFLTVLDDQEEEATGLELGAADYVSRPVKPAILRSRIRTHVALKKNREALEQMVSERSDNLRHARSTIQEVIGSLKGLDLEG